MAIDVNVHHLYSRERDILGYLPEGYAERFEEYGQPLVGVRGLGNTVGFSGLSPHVTEDAVSTSSTEGPLAFTQEHLLDKRELEHAILLGSPPFWAPSSIPNKDYGNAICRAYNDYTVEQWLDKDERLAYSLTVNHQDPDEAAAEIRRLGEHSQVVAVNLTPRTDRPFGNKAYDPIYEAAEETDLAITIHPGYDAAGIHGHPPSPAGYPNMSVESRLVRPTQIQAHISSLVFEGTFEKFPELRVACLGWGWDWIFGYFWRINTEWKNLRTEVPWVERDPTEYIKDHVRFDIDPTTSFESNQALEAIFEWVDADELLMYGSDFPHEVDVGPEDAFSSLSPEARQRVTSTNAAEFFRFT